MLQDVFKGRLTAFVHNAGLYVNVTTTSAEMPANLAPDEDWNDRIYDYYQKVAARIQVLLLRLWYPAFPLLLTLHHRGLCNMVYLSRVQKHVLHRELY